MRYITSGKAQDPTYRKAHSRVVDGAYSATTVHPFIQQVPILKAQFLALGIHSNPWASWNGHPANPNLGPIIK